LTHRPFWASVLVLAATVLLLAGSLFEWSKDELLDSNTVAAVGGRLLEDSRVRNAVSLYLVDELYREVDVAAKLRASLPSKYRSVAEPASAAIRLEAPAAVAYVLRLPFVVSVWDSVVAVAQRDLLKFVNGDPSTKIGIYLALRPLLLELAARIGIERQVAASLPADAARLPLLSGERIGELRQGMALVRQLAIDVPVAAVVLFAAALVVSRGRRREVLRSIGVAVALAGGTLLAVRPLAGPIVVDWVAGSNALAQSVESDAWRTLTGPISPIAWSTIAAGLIALALAALAGPSPGARALRDRAAAGLTREPLAWIGVALAGLLVIIELPAPDTPHLLVRAELLALLTGGILLVRGAVRADAQEDVGQERAPSMSVPGSDRAVSIVHPLRISDLPGSRPRG